MQKIMFNDKYGLTQAVLEGKKTQTRRVCKVQPEFKSYEIAFPVGWINEDDPLQDPLYGAYRWVNKDNPKEKSDWIIPQFKVGEVVAIVQSYKDAANWALVEDCKEFEGKEPWLMAGWNNKMFVRPDYMPHQIRITNVRVERLQDISDKDCLAEGIIKGKVGSEDTHFMDAYYIPNKPLEPICTPREAYAELIDKVSGKGTWYKNPYVWVYDFELIK